MNAQNNASMSLRRVAVAALFAGLLGITTACGGNPTDTPVPPTNTAALPTSTTASAAALPTSTTASVAANTPTTAMAGETPTAGMVGITPTGVMTSTTGSTGTLTGSGADILKTSTQAMKDVKTYHFTMTIGSNAAGQTSTTSADGDFVHPDSMAMSLTVAIAGQNTSVQMVKIGTDTWTNIGGTWTKSSTPTTPTDPSSLTSGFTGTADDLGDTTLNGVDVHHVKVTQDTNVSGTAAKTTTEAWIDKATNYITQMKLTVDTSAAGQASTSDITAKFSKFNDPSIKVADPTK